MKIHIFYSHYNITKTDHRNRPVWFDYENCFLNLLESIKDKNVELHLIMDGVIENNWISKYKDYYIPHEIKGGNMINVTLAMYEIIKNTDLEETDLVYILENDYLHTLNWIEKVLELYDTFKGLNYISLYDHKDKYFLPMYDDLVSKIFVTDTCHWRTTPSTCGSYITTKKIFDEDYDDHTGISVPIGDHHKWLFLNQTKNRFILTPVPGLSTHCVEGLLSPTINWGQMNQSYNIGKE